MTARNAMSAGDRRAMADAMRHMHHAGVRRIDLKQTSRLTDRQVHQAITFVILPGRDDIGSSADVVTPRHVSSSFVSGDLPVVHCAGRDAADGRKVLRRVLGLVAPAAFLAGSGEAISLDGDAQGSAGLVGGEAFGHADQIARPLAPCHGAAMGKGAP